MAIPIYHLRLKKSESDHYYRTLSALYNDKGANLGTSIYTLQRYDFSGSDFVNDYCTIKKGFVYNSAEIESQQKAYKELMRTVRKRT